MGVCDSSLVNKKATFVWGRKKKGKKAKEGSRRFHQYFMTAFAQIFLHPKTLNLKCKYKNSFWGNFPSKKVARKMLVKLTPG